MLPATQEEIDRVTGYMASQAPDRKVQFLQKVYSENVLHARPADRSGLCRSVATTRIFPMSSGSGLCARNAVGPVRRCQSPTSPALRTNRRRLRRRASV